VFHTFVKNFLTLVASFDLLTKLYYLLRHYFANEGLLSVYRWLLNLRFIVIALLSTYNVSSDREHYLRLRTSFLTLKVSKDDDDVKHEGGHSSSNSSSEEDSDDEDVIRQRNLLKKM
jgi:hypothetical protein